MFFWNCYETLEPKTQPERLCSPEILLLDRLFCRCPRAHESQISGSSVTSEDSRTLVCPLQDTPGGLNVISSNSKGFSFFSCTAHDGSWKRKMYLYSSCTRKTWWALCEQTKGDSFFNQYNLIKRKLRSIIGDVGDVWYQKCKTVFLGNMMPTFASFSLWILNSIFFFCLWTFSASSPVCHQLQVLEVQEDLEGPVRLDCLLILPALWSWPVHSRPRLAGTDRTHPAEGWVESGRQICVTESNWRVQNKWCDVYLLTL